jgi:hypothetical protein
MLATAIVVGFELAVEIAHVEPSQPRRSGAVSTPIEPMTGEAGVRRAGMTAAQCDELSALSEGVGGGRFDLCAGGERRCEEHGSQTPPG